MTLLPAVVEDLRRCAGGYANVGVLFRVSAFGHSQPITFLVSLESVANCRFDDDGWTDDLYWNLPGFRDLRELFVLDEEG